jgi:hypothetical protein
MKLEEVRPAHCYGRAQRLLAEVGLVRDELGRGEDHRPGFEAGDAPPRACYFAALAVWNQVERLAAEIGVGGGRLVIPPAPAGAILPGHVLEMIHGVLARVEEIKARLGVVERVPEPALELEREPGDVLATLVKVSRQVALLLERPFAPGDVFTVVALASTYATRLGGTPEPMAFERRKQPRHCYARLLACHHVVAERIRGRGEKAMMLKGVPSDVVPGDCYDLAHLVLCEVVYLHAITSKAVPVGAFEAGAAGHRLPSHVDQLARTLEAQLLHV